MKKILITGAMGQLGSELLTTMREIYGDNNVIGTDLRMPEKKSSLLAGPFYTLDVLDDKAMAEIAGKEKVDTIVHLAALLSATAEANPLLAWKINMGGLMNALEVARAYDTQFFTPSSIGAFGESTPKVNTPQDTIQRPSTIYGVSKVAGELLCDYYFEKYNLDTRGVRFPGLIGYVTPPGGGTTDYAVDIYYEALKKGAYQCNIAAGTFMDMMYMPDAIKATIDLMEADPAKLIHRNAFNITSMSVDPEMIGQEIRKHIPEFKLTYQVDPIKQKIASRWPDSIDCTAAIEEWGFNPSYNLETMTKDMLEKLRIKLSITNR